ncbi:chromate efflux transporter [Pendulispora albinea]|uniref:Chromate efflux transporter n=1 Tax=Pendulispora albinea TaxID=2741071 RepID=A0ABZ2M3H6_9BACT
MKELALVFLRLGTTAFGGPAAHIAMMEDEFVRRRGWLTREQFLDLVGAANLIPGPSSTEVAIYVGYRRAGWRGLLVAGTCFVLPAALLVTLIAWAYVRFGWLPSANGVLHGIKAVIIAVIVQALVAFARTAIKSKWLAALAALAAIAHALGAAPVAILAGAGVLHALARAASRRHGNDGNNTAAKTIAWGPIATPTIAPALTASTLAAPAIAHAAPSLVKLFLIFAKIGAVVFGSGYVLLAFLRTDLVEQTHWLTESQLIDAVAIGQFTPGPVFTTATFIGYVLAGMPGAIAATVGIFLPSFALVAVSGPILPKLRQSPTFSAFLDGVNAASLALMAVVGFVLARTALVDVPTVLLALASAAVLLRWRINSAWLVLGGGLAGLALEWYSAWAM